MADYLATLAAKMAQSFHVDFLRSSIKHSDIIYTKSAVRADVDPMLKGEFRQNTLILWLGGERRTLTFGKSVMSMLWHPGGRTVIGHRPMNV